MKDMFKTKTQKIKSFLKIVWDRKKEKKVWIPSTIVLLFILFKMFSGGASADVYTYTVTPREFVQLVSLTGKVIAAKNVDLGFETSGRVGRVNFKVGDQVKAGTVIASIANGDYVATLNKNYALVAGENARLRDVQSGSKKDDLALSQADLVNAESDLSLARQTFADQLRDTYAKVDDAVRFKIDNTFKNPLSVNPEFMYSVDQNPYLKDSLSTQRLKIGETLDAWRIDMSIENIVNIRRYLTEIQSFINDTSLAISIVSGKVSSSDVGYADIYSNKTDIAAARVSFATAVTALNQAETAYKVSMNALTKIKNQLTVKQSVSVTDIDIQRANLSSAQASVASAQAMVGKTLIRAPFDGVITKIDIKEGEIASPNTPVVSLLNDGEYQIETFVSENDIAKLRVGQVAKVSLDAYGRDVIFEAMVISVDPAETLKDGVSTYRTKIQFVTKDERIKSGLTSNIEIETDRRVGILQIPQAGLFLEKGIKKVYVLKNIACLEKATSTTSVALPVISPKCATYLEDKKDLATVEIKTGEINNTGDIEILSGLNDGDTIIYSPKVIQ